MLSKYICVGSQEAPHGSLELISLELPVHSADPSLCYLSRALAAQLFSSTPASIFHYTISL